MAEEDVSEAPNQSAKGGGGAGMLPALLVIVLTPVISFAMFKFMVVPMIKDAIPEQGERAPIKAEDIDIKHVPEETFSYLFDDVVTNVKGTNQTRFVQVAFSVYSANPELEGLIEKYKPKMKHVAIGVLGNLTLADLEKREIKNTVSSQLKQGFDHVIGFPLVEEIYFSQFVVQ